MMNIPFPLPNSRGFLRCSGMIWATGSPSRVITISSPRAAWSTSWASSPSESPSSTACLLITRLLTLAAQIGGLIRIYSHAQRSPSDLTADQGLTCELRHVGAYLFGRWPDSTYRRPETSLTCTGTGD